MFIFKYRKILSTQILVFLILYSSDFVFSQVERVNSVIGSFGLHLSSLSGLSSGYFMYNSGAQPGPVTRETFFLPNGYELRPGYLARAGKLPMIKFRSPSLDRFGTKVNTLIRAQVNTDLDPMQINSDNLRLRAIRDRTGTTVNENIPCEVTYYGIDQEIRLRPLRNLYNNWTYRIDFSSQVVEIEEGLPLYIDKLWRFSTIMNPTEENIVVDDRGVKLTIPANTFDREIYITVDNDPINMPREVNTTTVVKANSQAQQIERMRFPILYTELNVYDNEDTRLPTDPLAKEVTLTIPYLDNDGDGYVDGVKPRVHTKTLSLYRLNETAQAWVKIPKVSLDRSTKSVIARVLHFSVYTVMGANVTETKDAYAYPVPYRGESGGIKFRNLPDEGTVRIFTVSGDLIRELKISPDTMDDNFEINWDVKNVSGQDIVSGVYLYQVKSGKSSKNGKLIIIR